MSRWIESHEFKKRFAMKQEDAFSLTHPFDYPRHVRHLEQWIMNRLPNTMGYLSKDEMRQAGSRKMRTFSLNMKPMHNKEHFRSVPFSGLR